MPINDQIKPFYPDNWGNIRSLVLDRAKKRTSSIVREWEWFDGCGGHLPFDGLSCEKCGVPNEEFIYRSTYTGKLDMGASAIRDRHGKHVSDEPVWVIPCKRRAVWWGKTGLKMLDLGRDPIDSKRGLSSSEKTEVVLTIAHLNHDPRDNRADNLAALCQRCHLKYDQRPEQKERRRKVYSELLGQQAIDGLETVEVSE